MTEEDVKTIAMHGLSDAMRKSPVVYAVVLEAVLIVFLAWWLISDYSAERQHRTAYVETLHAELVECHSTR